MSPGLLRLLWLPLLSVLILGLASGATAAKKKTDRDKEQDPYADLVWPPPPAKARIKLEQVIRGRVDLEGRSRLSRAIIGRSRDRLDWLIKPYAVGFDSRGRILVSDSSNGALFRFDRDESRVDVFGTRIRTPLQRPLGLHISADDVVFVADAKLRQVLAIDDEGNLVATYGGGGQLVNPTDAQLSADGKRLYVADSRAHRVQIFDRADGSLIGSIGRAGSGDGEFNFPSALALDAEGNLYVLDQVNGRVQIFGPDDSYLDQFGGLGRGFGTFARPKDVVVDEVGFIYVTDFAFSNFQIFDIDFALLTFVGSGGGGPGQFNGISGIAVSGDEIAVVDQLGKRLQIFRFIVPKDAG